MTLLYIRTLPLLPEEGPEGRRPPPSNDTYKETSRVGEPSRAHPVRSVSTTCVAYSETTTGETPYII